MTNRIKSKFIARPALRAVQHQSECFEYPLKFLLKSITQVLSEVLRPQKFISYVARVLKAYFESLEITF